MKTRPYFLILTVFLSIWISLVLCQRTPSTDNVDRSKIRCYNGTIRSGRCMCYPDYIGDYCERKMNCLGYERRDTIYCVACRVGWKGEFCDEIDCGEHGKQLTFEECECEDPFSGPYCTELLTQDAYLTYNRENVQRFGPIGIIAVIPMLLMWFGCKRLAEKRKAKRVEKALEDQHKRDLDFDEVRKLLKSKS